MWFKKYYDELFFCVLLMMHPGFIKCDTCGKNEVLSPSPLYCEPTCTENCPNAGLKIINKNEPTCSCLPGFVRHNGRCIRKNCCPKNNTAQVRIKSIDQRPSALESVHQQKPYVEEKDEQIIYILDADIYPGLIWTLESGNRPDSKSIALPVKAEYGSTRLRHYERKADPEEPPSTPFRYPITKNRIHRAPEIVQRPYEVKPPKCNRTQELTFCRPRCVPTCDNDCSSSVGFAAKPICIAELSCACIAGYVLHDDRCIRKDKCPNEKYARDKNFAPKEEQAPYALGSRADADLLPEYDDYGKPSSNESDSYEYT